MTKNNNYRPDIDGLRAFAVISVILFHLDFEFASGGFIGVDIFFVISGYLITKIIKKEVDRTGQFDFTNFYLRRIRRIFPALVVTILISTFISILLFSPPHLEQVGGSLIHALSGLSNVYFWTEAGYFDSAKDVKPLLHTWSLGIEEQFYFLWPLLFSFVIRTNSRFLLLLTLFGMISASLFLNYLFSDGHVDTISKFSSSAAALISDGKSTIFYLLPFRIYEFGVGAALVFVSSYSFNNKAIDEFIMIVGIGLVTYSFFMFSEQTVFPGTNALFPCIGSAFIIYSGNKSKLLGGLFNNKTFVNIGLISYSLYLVHWPIIVFWKYYTFEKISLTQSIVIMIISIILAKLMYEYVEQPFRVKKNADNNNNKLVSTSAVAAFFACSILVVVASNIWKNEGWYWRIDMNISKDLIPPKIEEIVLKKLSINTEWTKASLIGRTNETSTNVLILGDSHADHLKGAAKYLSKKYNLTFTFFTFRGCPPIFGTYKVMGTLNSMKNLRPREKKCLDQTKIWEEYIATNQFDYVILSARWNWLFEPKIYYDTVQWRSLLIDKSNRKFTIDNSKKVFSKFLDYTIKTIHNSGAKVIVFAQVPNSGIDLEGCNNVPHIIISDKLIEKRCSHVPQIHVLKRSEFSTKTIKHITSINNAIAVIPTDYFCKEGRNFCDNIVNRTRLKDDDDHINEYGSVYLAQQWEMDKDFPFKVN